MGESACSCDDPELVVVYDKNMEKPYVSGNRYCRFCRNCGRRYFCKDTYWEQADEQWVIPMGEDEPIPGDQYEAEYDENFFNCPECGHPHFGEPDSCEQCEADYNW